MDRQIRWLAGGVGAEPQDSEGEEMESKQEASKKEIKISRFLITRVERDRSNSSSAVASHSNLPPTVKYSGSVFPIKEQHEYISRLWRVGDHPPLE